MVRSRDTDSRSGLNNGGPLDAKCGSPIIERAIHWANKLVNKAGTPGKKQIRSPSSPPSGVAFGDSSFFFCEGPSSCLSYKYPDFLFRCTSI